MLVELKKSDIHQNNQHNYFNKIWNNISLLINHGLWNCPMSQSRGKNIKQPDNTPDTYSAPSTPSYSYDKLHKYTDISSKNHSLQRKML